MTTTDPIIPDLPRFSGDWAQDVAPMANWMDHVYRRLTTEDEIGQRIADAQTAARQDAAAELEVLLQSISPTPTAVEVANIQASLNGVILFLRGETEG